MKNLHNNQIFSSPSLELGQKSKGKNGAREVKREIEKERDDISVKKRYTRV